MSDNTEDKKKQISTPGFMKELLSGSMVSEKIILKNLGYVSLVTALSGNLHREQVSCRKNNQGDSEAHEGSEGSES